jgi:hypothetical protein
VPPPVDWWVPGPPVQAPLLNIDFKESLVTILVERWKVIFLLDSGACFSVLPFSPGPWSKQSYYLGHIWPAPRVLFYLTFGLLLGRPPLLSFFSHSSWNSSTPVGMGFTIST